jgi:hypothetical protein
MRKKSRKTKCKKGEINALLHADFGTPTNIKCEGAI